MNALELRYPEAMTILAALRLFQRTRDAGGALPPCDPTKHVANETTIGEMEHSAECDPLTDEQIDALCESIEWKPEDAI